MYPAVLLLHSWLRWVVIALAVTAVVRALAGARARRAWSTADSRVGRLFVIALDMQVVLGFLLYFVLSPITKAALVDFGGAMKVSAMRFWAVEHAFGMLAAVALAHIGSVRVRKTADPLRKHKAAAICFALALVAILVSIPWPFMPNGRPLFPW